MNATLTITAYDMSVNGTAGATSQTSAAVTFGTFLKGDKGDKGDDGADGVTPHIGSNGNWYIGTTDTLVKARATDGADGVTPHIGDNGNWFFGTTDSGVKARGTDGTTDYDQLTNKPTIPTKTSDLTNDSGFLTSHQDISTKLSVKETLANGNIVLTDGNGNEKQYMAATPSGNPNHNIFLYLGAIWNATSGYWELNELTDITNKEIDIIYAEYSPSCTQNTDCYSLKGRTTFARPMASSNFISLSNAYVNCNNLETLRISELSSCAYSQLNGSFRSLPKLIKIITIINLSYLSNKNNFSGTLVKCNKLESVSIFGLKVDLSLHDLKSLNTESIAYMINNSQTATITITLHADAYARAIADADVLTALRTKTNVTLTDGTNSINNPA